MYIFLNNFENALFWKGKILTRKIIMKQGII
jgi:hypothetical protein